jgi:Spc7 kinetochore protein/Knl1 RWD C-terminal domain/MELT motif
VPLTPPKAIPTFDETRKRSAGRSGKKSPKHDGAEELLIDFSTPAPRHVFSIVTGAENIQDPFSPIRKTAGPEGHAPALLLEGKMQAAVTEDEAEEERKAQKQAILDRRAARRTSMANRRVSFAPEATLHTWNVVEIVEDSTTSSASNSTRRQSSMTAAKIPNRPEQNSIPASDQSEPPSTPPTRAEEPLVRASPASQRDWQARDGRRRSSRVSDINVEGVDHNKSSPASTYSESSAVGDSSPIHVEDSIHSSSDEDGDTAMSMDDATGQTVQSQISNSSTASSLDSRLRRAAAVAGTRGIEYDENGDDLSMELAEGTITNAFQPWVNGQPRARVQDVSAMQDQENVNPFSPAFKVQADATILQASDATEEDESEGATMDMTVAAGGIISEDASTNCSPALPTSFVDNSDNVVEAVDDSVDCDGQGDTMDMTVAAGGIIFRDTTTNYSPSLQPTFEEKSDDFVKDVEDSVLHDGQGNTMDMTVVTGGILSNDKATKLGSASPIPFGENSDNVDNTAEVPFLHDPVVHTPLLREGQGDTMDMTQAAGDIISDDRVTKSRTATPISSRKISDNVVKAAEVPVLHYPDLRDSQGDTMDMTVATGGIISNDRATKNRSRTASPTSLRKNPDNVVKAADVPVLRDSQEQQVEKISLQEFLNMANIHFMELSTTKRRHTLAPGPPSQPLQEVSSPSNEACFAAAATTLPLLELYQHASRELKSYISTGRKVIRSIEQETLAEQPALFREYVDARPDVKMIMDNQFRNGKANARLQSKEGWYTWRRQLVDGLRTGLDGIKAGMEEDAQSLSRQEAILERTVPKLVEQLEGLGLEAQKLQQRAEDFESVDYDALNKARNQLESVDDEVSKKTALLAQLQQQMTDKEEALSAAAELKVEFQGQIAEAERVQDQYRGWKVEEVIRLRDRVEAIEKKSGWELVTVEHEVTEGGVDYGPAFTMRYRHALRLFFYPSAFYKASSVLKAQGHIWRANCHSGPSPPISLTYAPAEVDATTTPDLTTQQRFFLQLLQGQLHALAVLPEDSVTCTTLVTLVSQGWDLAAGVSEEIRLLNFMGITTVSILSDEQLGVQCMLTFPQRCRVDVNFTLTSTPTIEGSISTSVSVEATPRYGSVTALLAGAKASKIREALNKQTNSKAIGQRAWVAAVRGLDEWVTAQMDSRKDVKEEIKKDTTKEREKTPTPASIPAPESTAPEVSTPTRAPKTQKKELKRPVPMEEVMEEAAARQEDVRKLEEEELLLMSAGKTPLKHGRRPGALRRSP